MDAIYRVRMMEDNEMTRTVECSDTVRMVEDSDRVVVVDECDKVRVLEASYEGSGEWRTALGSEF